MEVIVEDLCDFLGVGEYKFVVMVEVVVFVVSDSGNVVVIDSIGVVENFYGDIFIGDNFFSDDDFVGCVVEFLGWMFEEICVLD